MLLPVIFINSLKIILIRIFFISYIYYFTKLRYLFEYLQSPQKNANPVRGATLLECLNYYWNLQNVELYLLLYKQMSPSRQFASIFRKNVCMKFQFR